MITLDYLKSSDRIIEDLAYPFDFDLNRAADAWWFELSTNDDFEVIAGDSTGGLFIAYGNGAVETRPLLYASSEGQAGKIAANLTAFLGMLVEIPFWSDLLKFSGGGNLSEMRKTAIFMRRKYEKMYPVFPAVRERLIETLPIPIPKDPIKDLHDSVHSTDCLVLGEEDGASGSLFNNFISSDNPS